MFVNQPVSPLDVHSLLAMQENGELNKLRKTLSAPSHGQQELAGGWSIVEMQHLVPLLTVLGSGVVLSATCLLLEHGARRWAARRDRSMIERKRAAAFRNQIATKTHYYA
jgi:hypothetical protein